MTGSPGVAEAYLCLEVLRLQARAPQLYKRVPCHTNLHYGRPRAFCMSLEEGGIHSRTRIRALSIMASLVLQSHDVRPSDRSGITTGKEIPFSSLPPINGATFRSA
jgi:hypothetical protein